MDSPSVSSPFKTVLNTVGPHHEKALKQAFYNTAALIFAFLCSIGLIIAYYVLEPFLRPLIWAALCGTFLYPFKKSLTEYVKRVLLDMEERETLLALGVTLIPFKILDKSTSYLQHLIKTYYKSMISSCVLILVSYYFIKFHPVYQIFSWIEFMCSIVVKMLSLFDSPIMAWSLFVCFWIMVLFFHTPSGQTDEHKFLMKYTSLIVWLIMAFHFISLAGVWRVPLVMLMLVLIAFGLLGERKKESTKESTIKSVVDRTLFVFGIPIHKVNSNEKFEAKNVETVETVANVNEMADAPKTGGCVNPNIEALKATPVLLKKSVNLLKQSVSRKSKPTKQKERIANSDPYFMALFWAFAISRVWLNLWIIQVFPIFFIFFCSKFMLTRLEVKEFFLQKLKDLKIYNMVKERSDIIVPSPVRTVLTMMFIGDRKILSWITASLDKLISILIILCLIMVVFTGTAFFAVQVHHESSYLITVATDIMNKTVTSNQEYLRYLNINDSDIRSTFDSTLHSAYMLGRKKMASFVSSSINDNHSSSTDIENQITQFLDQLYGAWFLKHNESEKKMKRLSKPKEDHRNSSDLDTTSNNTSANTNTPVKSNMFTGAWNKIKHVLKPSDLGRIADVLKENMHTLYSVLDSVWVILKGNVNLVFSIVTHVISAVLFSGTYLLNAVISTIIFMTTLFYLLSGSSNEYKLVEWFSGVSMGTMLAESINKAIQDVFGASLKMAMFYGLYTWFTHSLFGANLVFIPAALAATFGVVPFIGTYWAALPAAFELWLIQDESVMGALLIALHMLPTYVVDTAIYSEIGGGGHPYLTGLAIAGGVYCIGLEGAFIGPIVLCCLIAAFDVYNGIMSEDVASDVTMKGATSSHVDTRWRRTLSEDRL